LASKIHVFDQINFITSLSLLDKNEHSDSSMSIDIIASVNLFIHSLDFEYVSDCLVKNNTKYDDFHIIIVS
jgi:hypothetical protein